MTSGAEMWDVIGWGYTQSGVSSNVLLEIEVSVADNEDCKISVDVGNFTENMICTKIEEGKAICNVIYLFKT